MKIRLVNYSDDFVHETQIPAFKVLPEVVTFGGKTYRSVLPTLQAYNDAGVGWTPTYKEVYAYHIPA